MDISTRHLRSFLTLVEHRNFTKAAKVFCLSQPAFSAMVRSTETALGVELVDRSSSQFRLTPAGEAFTEIASTTLAHFDERVRELQNRSLATEKVTVASMVTLTYGLLPSILAAYQSDCPQVQLELKVDHPVECIEMVEAKKVDFAVTAIDSLPNHLHVEPLFREPFHVVCRADHPLANLHQIGLRDLVEHPFVHYRRGRMTRRLIDAAVHPDQIQIAQEVEHVHTIRALVESGSGISVIPAGTRSHFAGTNVVLRPIERNALWRDIVLIFHPNRPPPPQAMPLIAHIRKALPQNLKNESGASES